MVGLYAITSFDATMRLREMSIRMTLGASAGDVRRLIVRGILWPVTGGIAIGLLAAWWVAQFARAFLFEIDARDPSTAFWVGASFVAVALTTAWVAARRATRADPASVLKAM
jgi:ABC-type antimicrobial peptide transport system permease subunit